MSNCQNCAKLQAENDRLNQMLQQVKVYCSKVLGDANRVLAGNNPKAVWSYNKAIKDKFEPIDKFLSN